jgi:MFS family permease
MPAWLEQFPQLNVGNGGSAQLQGTVVAIYEIGCLCGSLFIYVAGDYLGRRRAIWLGCSILIIGAILQTLSYSIPQMIVGRIVTGVGNGINTSTIPVWHSETTSPTSRGRAVSIELATTIFGLMLAYWVDFGLGKVDGPISWRLPLSLQIVPGMSNQKRENMCPLTTTALLTIIFVFFAPESPRWLLKNRSEAASRATLSQLSVHQGPEREQAIDADFRAIQMALEEEKEALPKNDKGEIIAPFRACFTNGKERYFHRMMLGVGGQFIVSASSMVVDVRTCVYSRLR